MLTPIMRPILQPVLVPVDYEYGDGDDPMRLFAGGKKGYLFDFLDRSTLFQDTAGTIPALAIGDPVALALDKSGNGNHLVLTTATKRPLVSVDGLAFDGIDDCFVTIGAVDTGGSESVAVFYGGEYEASASYEIIVEASPAAYAGTFYLVRSFPSTPPNRVARRVTGPVSSTISSPADTADTPPTKSVLAFLGRVTQGNTRSDLYFNGALRETATPDLGVTDPFANYLHYVGCRNQNTFFYKGTMTSLACVFKECTDNEVKAMSRYINNRMGGVY